ncbi:hypothetical protein REPUB_Repub08aG0026000 [Reevesia pubescens]
MAWHFGELSKVSAWFYEHFGESLKVNAWFHEESCLGSKLEIGGNLDSSLEERERFKGKYFSPITMEVLLMKMPRADVATAVKEEKMNIAHHVGYEEGCNPEAWKWWWIGAILEREDLENNGIPF